jgi:error-prone DNA polymerase
VSANYAELSVTSNFSFLRGGSHPEELAAQAKAIGLSAIGLADRNTVAGLVRAHSKAKEDGLRFLPGARLVFADGTPDVLAYPHSLSGWSQLTRLLTIGKRRAEKGDCILSASDLIHHAPGLSLIVSPPQRLNKENLVSIIARLREASGLPVRLAASMLYRGDDARHLERLSLIAREARAPIIAVNDVLYHHPDRRPLQDVLTCIREHSTLDQAGKRLAANAERHLKPPQEMARLFRRHPGAIEETLAFVEACRFSLDELKPSYPLETRQGYATPQDALSALSAEGAKRRYPGGVPDKIRKMMDYELNLVAELSYAPYFLTVHDIVSFARGEGILCQGRGSAANSALCFCLGVTEVDPLRSELLFERFISAERGEPPDIDVDFEHERREEVLQYVYRKYGRERAALTATTICYRGRSAIREVGKVFGLSENVTAALASTLWGWSPSGVTDDEAKRAGLDPNEPRLARVLSLADELIDFPRHLSQHVGGFVITEGRLDEIVPIENAAMDERTVIEWNKDDIEALGILKVDLLGLGMLSCLRKSLELLDAHYNVKFVTTADIPPEEKPVYDMLSRADSIGVFQVESRAQMSMLPRLKPKEFYDLVIEVAIVRPGPIQGDMVHPYLRRRQGLEQVKFPSPSPEHGPPDELEKVLKKTLGVPLFQEQAMRVAIEAAKFAPAEADRLRRAMATFRRVGTIQTFRDKFIANMSARGYEQEFAAACFKQIEGFGEYGFPESHAASFALLVYASAWIKCHYPDVFAAALLNSQPMGFYAPAQIVRDALEHGVALRPVDVNFSLWDNRLEGLMHHPPSASHKVVLGTSPAGGGGKIDEALDSFPPPFTGEVPAQRAEGGQSAGRLHPRHAAMRGDILSDHALRLGFRQISGFQEKDAKLIEAAREARAFFSLRDFWLRSKLTPAVLKSLAEADAFGSLGLSRREALWSLRALRRVGDKDDLPLFARAALPDLEPDAGLPAMPPGEQVVEDYRHLHLSLKGHPLAFLRAELDRRKIRRSEELASLPPDRRLSVAGLVLVRQRPGSAESVFVTVEDETGIANIIVWPHIFERYRAIVMGARLIAVSGKLQSESGVIHVIAESFDDLTPMLRHLDETQASASTETAEVMPRGRNFH